MLGHHVPALVCPHPATQHSLHVEGPGRLGMQMGSFRPPNVMYELNSSKAMSLFTLVLSKSLWTTMLVTSFTSRDGLCKSLVPSTTFRSLGLAAENQRGEGGRGRKATKHPEVTGPPKPPSHRVLGACMMCSVGLLLGGWEELKTVEKEDDTAAQPCPRDMKGAPLPTGTKAGLSFGRSEEPTGNHSAQIKSAPQIGQVLSHRFACSTLETPEQNLI